MLTMEHLKPRVVDVRIVIGKLPPLVEGGALRDDVLIVPLRVPGWVEWNEMGLETPRPVRAKVENFKDGKKVYVDESDAAYNQKLIVTNNEIMLRRLTFALIAGGNLPELKDAPADEQMKAVSGMDAGILQALVRVLNNLVQMTRGSVSDTVERFQGESLSGDGDADLQPESVDGVAVEGIG